MLRPRDTQRARLYRAEDHGSGTDRMKSVESCQAFVDEILSSRWAQVRWGRPSVLVRPGHGHRRATGGPSGIIQLPVWSRTKRIVCHELAHVLCPARYAWHGPEFAGLYLTLVARFVGPAAAARLRAGFKTEKVRSNNRAVPEPRYRVVTKTAAAAKARARANRAVAAHEAKEAVEVIRRAVATGVFGPTGTKPRTHALATARTLERQIPLTGRAAASSLNSTERRTP